MRLPCDQIVEELPLLKGDVHNVTSDEYLQTIASRLLYSRSCGVYYFSLLAASVTEVVWILHPWAVPGHERRIDYPDSWLFFLVELYLTAGLFGETALRIVRQRAAFWGQCGNVFDAAVCVLSLVSFALPLLKLAREMEVALLSIMAAWVWLRMARLLSVARTLHRQRSTAVGRLDVSFDDGLGRHSSCSSSNGSSDEDAVLGVITEGAEQQQQQHALLRPRSLPTGLGRLSS